MKTSEETKYGPSVVTDTLQTLSTQAKHCHEMIDQLEAAQSVTRSEVLAEVGKLLDLCQNLRDAILSEDHAASWKSKSELSTLVARLDDAAARRRRYLDLAQFLASGTIVHRRDRTRQERLALRDTAVAELMEISDRSTPPELPGPEAEHWLEWACSLEDDTNEPDLQQLKNGFPRLDDFVRQLEIDWWRNGAEFESGNSRSKRKNAPVAPKIEPAAPIVNESETKEEIVKTEPIAAAPSETVNIASHETPVAPAAAVEVPVAETQTAERTLEPEPPQAEALDAAPEPFLASDGIEEELPAETFSPSRQGKVSFFPWDQIDQFTKHIDKANVERKDSRTVRALLAVSHWLEPKEHNPLTHPKCGIRALTGHPGGTDFEWVSPSDVMQAIALDEGLPLLTGGADLLRWGLLQPSERNFQGIASVRRFTREHLKAWFSELYRIALSDKQIDDILNLTSGIPILIGELHKLIIPVPEDPPTWLGLARWIEIKAQFEKQLPTIAHELKKGTPAVRLTDREISLLNMIILVSGDSTRETIVSNLSDNWERYQHPEYRPFSSRDEISLAVLLELGLLPKRTVTGVEPSKTLLPVKHDDAIRKIVEHL